MNFETFIIRINALDNKIAACHKNTESFTRHLHNAYKKNDSVEIKRMLLETKKNFEELISAETDIVKILFGEVPGIKLGYWWNEHRTQIKRAEKALKAVDKKLEEFE
jgi:hypothetical protein